MSGEGSARRQHLYPATVGGPAPEGGLNVVDVGVGRAAAYALVDTGTHDLESRSFLSRRRALAEEPLARVLTRRAEPRSAVWVVWGPFSDR